MSKIVSIRKVANEGFQAEMEGLVQRPGAINVLAYLNKGDARFNNGNTRKVWFPVTILTLQEDFQLNDATISKLQALEQGEKLEVNIENPTIAGEELAIQVNETIVADPYQRQHMAKTAKQLNIDEKVAKSKIKTTFDLSKYLGQVGYFLTEEGDFIYSRTQVTIKSQINHTFVEGTLVPETELASYGNTLGFANPQTEGEELQEVGTEDERF